MKKILLLVLSLCITYGCQDVIEVEVPIDQPRLVVDAVIRVTDVQNPTTTVRIKTSVTSSFFEDVSPASPDAVTLVNNQSNVALELSEEISGSGIYRTDISTDFLTVGELLSLIHI